MLHTAGDVAGAVLHRHHHHHHQQPPPPPPPTLFHFLQLTIISAQDLHPTCSKAGAYALAWVDPDYKLRTRVDRISRTNPSWNDKFVFRVDSAFLRSDTAAVTIDIKRASPMGLWPDPIIGTARLVLSAVNPSPATQFVAVQIRRPTSLRPQGILNLGVTVCSEMVAARESFNRRSASWRRKGEEIGEEGRRMVDKGSKALQLKLAEWRTEISPAVVDLRGKSERKKGQEEEEEEEDDDDERLFGCFYGGRRRRRRRD